MKILAAIALWVKFLAAISLWAVLCAMPRPSLMLREIARRYPYAWRIIDLFRRDRGKDGLPDWPEWCYCPMAADPNQYRQWGYHPHHPRGTQMTSDEFAAIRRQLGNGYAITSDLCNSLSGCRPPQKH